MEGIDRISSALPFLDEVGAGVTILDDRLELVWANTFFREHLAELPGLCGKHCFAGLGPQGRRCEDCLPPLAQRSGRVQETVRTSEDAAGILSYFRVIASPMTQGDPSFVCVMILPLPTEEMEAEQSWRERFLLSAIRNSNDAVFALDRTDTVRFWNRGAERTFGWSIENMVGSPVQRLFAGDDFEDLANVFTPADPLAHLSNRELQMATQDRGDIWVEVSRTPLLDGSGKPNGYSFVVRDVTERKRAAEQMAFTERMIAVGNMAAAMAHEIGTPLGIINNNAENILLDLDEEDPLRDELSAIVRETDRIGGLIQDLLRFSRPEKPEMESLQVSEVVDRVEHLIRHTAQKQGTRLEVEVQAGLPWVMGDANQLEQVVLNLAMNALQAVGGEGAVRIAVRATNGSGSEGEGVEIVVADDGPGLPEGAAERIFDPFYTTKANGTGLGLSVCRSLVEEHGGTLLAADRPEGGARFSARLPAEGRDRS